METVRNVSQNDVTGTSAHRGGSLAFFLFRSAGGVGVAQPDRDRLSEPALCPGPRNIIQCGVSTKMSRTCIFLGLFVILAAFSAHANARVIGFPLNGVSTDVVEYDLAAKSEQKLMVRPASFRLPRLARKIA